LVFVGTMAAISVVVGVESIAVLLIKSLGNWNTNYAVCVKVWYTQILHVKFFNTFYMETYIAC
jgi:hypothetical protein